MRVLLLSDFYWPHIGGVEQHVRSLAQGLTRAGHDVTVVTLHTPELPHREEDFGTPIIRIPSVAQRASWMYTSAERTWAPPIADPEVTLHLRRVIKSFRPDVVHGHDWLTRSFLPLRKWSRRTFGTCFASTLHYYTFSCPKKNLMHGLPHDGLPADHPCSGPRLGKCLACAGQHYGRVSGTATVLGNRWGSMTELRGADAIIAVSEATARGNGLAPDGRRVTVIPNFLSANSSPNQFPGDAPPDEAGHLATLPKGEFAMFVGDLRPMKGLDVLLRAYSGLDRPLPLVLIGKKGSDAPREFPSGAHVYDPLPNDLVIATWKRAAIGIVPSVWPEPFGLVIIEAMAGGTPVIGSDIGGIPDIIEHESTGLLVPPGDAQALRTALSRLIDDPETRAQMGAAALKRSADYSAEVVLPKIEAVYRQALAGRLAATPTCRVVSDHRRAE